MKKVGFLVLAVLVLGFGIGMTAKANFGKEEEISFEQRQDMEEEYLQQVRQILLEKGCKNAGITLTYVTDIEGNREYTLTMHHVKIKNMDAQELALLAARIQESAGNLLLGEVVLKQI